MNTINATIKEIQSHKGIMLITAAFVTERLSALVLSADAEYSKDEKIKLLFKESEVTLASLHSKISESNIFISPISSIEKGEILAQVTLAFHTQSINAIVTKKALDNLGFKVGESVQWFIKSNELSVQKI